MPTLPTHLVQHTLSERASIVLGRIPTLVQMKMAVLIVGLWRSFWAVEQSLKRMHPMQTLHTDVFVSTSQEVQCSRKAKCCPRSANVTASVQRLFPGAKVLIDEHPTTHNDRLHRAWNHFKSDLVDHELLYATRPDVLLTAPLHIDAMKQRGLYVVLGAKVRDSIFSNRDWDFGYMANPPLLLESWVCCTVNRTLPHSQPRLPAGLDGAWPTDPAKRIAVYENSLLELERRGSPLRVASALKESKEVFLSLRRECKAA